MAQTFQSAIRPFRIEISQASLDDLRSRILATRWPSKELVDDRSQGVQIATLRSGLPTSSLRAKDQSHD